MGQVPAKYMYPSAPYGSSQAMNTLNSAQPAAVNPQTPLLPPNFNDPGGAVKGASSTLNPQAPKPTLGGPPERDPLKMLFGL